MFTSIPPSACSEIGTKMFASLSFVRALPPFPSSRPAHAGAPRARGRQRLAVALVLPLAPLLPGHALTGPSTARAERIPLSGAAGGSFTGDVSVPLLGVDRKAEVKCRARGFQQLYKWLGGNDLLFVKQDRAEVLVVVPLRLALEIAQAAERRRGDKL